MSDLTAVSLFSGIGGLDRGLQLAGFRHLLMCEGGGDPNGTESEREQWKQGVWRRDVLRARFPGVPIADDVRDVHRERLVGGGESVAADQGWRGSAEHAAVALLAGGSPCQDLSVAGRRAGLDGDRSGLFFEMARVIDAVRPRWVLWENVPGALSSNGGRDFGVVLGTLVDLGYGLAWRVLDSRFFGVPQRRRRVFVVGAVVDGDPSAAAGRAAEVLAVGSRCGGHPATRGEATARTAVPFEGGTGNARFVGALGMTKERGGWRAGPDEAAVGQLVVGGPDDNNGQGGRLIASTMKSQRGKSGGGIGPEETLTVHTAASVRRLTPVECCRLQGLPDWWFDGVPGTSDSKMYAGLGDAVTATVAEWVGRRIVWQASLARR